MADTKAFAAALDRVTALAKTRHETLDEEPTIAAQADIDNALLHLPRSLQAKGLGLEATTDLLFETVLPSLASGHAGPRFWGFVTGGVAESAQIADMLVTLYDQNNAISLSEETIAAYLESLALKFVLELVGIPVETFKGRSCTTGATASNILALATAREYSVKKAKFRKDNIRDWSVAADGHGHIDVRIYSAGAHASTLKAAAINGLGRNSVIEVTVDEAEEPCAFDLQRLEQHLKEDFESGTAAIVVASIGEVNTGGITPSIPAVRELCDKYEAYLHVDAAFAGFAVLHPDFAHLKEAMASAHSLTMDAHKWLQIPYDCALFYCIDANLLQAVCGPGQTTAAYFAVPPSNADESQLSAEIAQLRSESRSVPSPFCGNLENSRRFRALPLYSSLVSLGKNGYEQIIRNNIEFARNVAAWLDQSSDYDLLLPTNSNFKIMNIVLFAPSAQCRDARLLGKDGVQECVRRIKATRRIYVTPTSWRGKSAIRLAVSNWRTTIERDFPIVVDVLSEVCREK